jgi:archaellum component FlaF (FlaF/FlaG flagellin family)
MRMHVRLVILLATALAAGPVPAAHAADVPAGVSVLTCELWKAGEPGQVLYSAHMRALPGTARMALRIRLFEKYGDGDFERISSEGLDVWRKSRAGASVFRYKQRVRGLHRGAVYRAVVHYRWFGSDGEVFLKARRRSQICSQGDALPNLQVASIETAPGEVENTAAYKATIVNRGDAVAQNIAVLLRVDGEVVDESEVIDALQPGEEKTVTFNGPVCQDRMRVVVDPKELIAESREQDNVHGLSCL